MDASGALALVRTAQDELVEVRDAPDKGAGAVGCFARLPCVFRCCAQLVFLPSSNLVMYLALLLLLLLLLLLRRRPAGV